MNPEKGTTMGPMGNLTQKPYERKIRFYYPEGP